MSETHLALAWTHAVYVGAALWMLVEALRLRRPLGPFTRRVMRRRRR